MADLTELPNIGKVLADKLAAIGITSYEDLIDMGSVEAVIRMGYTDRTACYNALYAVEGAIQGVRWHSIPKQERAHLKEEFDRALKGIDHYAPRE